MLKVVEHKHRLAIQALYAFSKSFKLTVMDLNDLMLLCIYRAVAKKELFGMKKDFLGIL